MGKQLRLVVVVSAVLVYGGGTYSSQTAGQTPAARVLSTQPEYVSGGDALVKIDIPAGLSLRDLSITLNQEDIAAMFRPAPMGDGLIGVVTGMMNGRNSIKISAPRRGSSELVVTNYPITGPILSGPHVTPFICQTESFLLPDGTKFGPAQDTNCSAATIIQYVYMPSGETAFKPMPSINTLPPDVQQTTTTTGMTVPFVVRVETATINRGIYQSAILHDPTNEPAPTPFAQPKGWNRRLVVIHGFGCPGGWYIQGAAQGNSTGRPGGMRSDLLDSERLAAGYAVFTNTLQHPSNNCNAVLQGESAMMSKERFIETYGVPYYTISHGCSGGAYSSLQLGDAMPGIFDGALIACTFPDPLGIALEGMHSHLLTHYFTATNPAGFNDAEKIAVTGYKSVTAFIDAAQQAQRTDPVSGRKDIEGYNPSVWNAAVPAAVRYDARTNSKGARPTIFDWARNVYGTDPATGFALRPFDNVGLQYGLEALILGRISKDQFLDLNEKVGGYDFDSNYVPQRTAGSPTAIRRAYQSGLHFTGGAGAASIPIIDTTGTYNDDSRYHYQWFHFAARERLREANGNAENFVMWRGNPVPYNQAWTKLIEWVEAYKADTSNDSQRAKVIRARTVGDGCFDSQGRFVSEPQTLNSLPNSRCNELYPSYRATQLVAGKPVSASIIKCQLKPVNPADYAPVSFTTAELSRLKAIFNTGVCDWSKPGVDQVKTVPFASFGPSPVNRLQE